MTFRSYTITLLILTLTTAASAQSKTDTVKIPLAKTSQLVFTMRDRSDLEILKHYDFQTLFQDILTKLDKNDTIPAPSDTTRATPPVSDPEPVGTWQRDEPKNDNDKNDDDDDEDWDNWKGHRKRWGRTWQSFNFDLGTNNYLESGSFPDKDNKLYSVKPWGSWYIAFNSIQRSRLGKNFFLEWGAGISWYTFKFQDASTRIVRTDTGIAFETDQTPDRSHIKSKLGITFVNASLVPVLDFGDHSRKPRIWNGYHSAFRIGLGPYVGYRISSLTKAVYRENGSSRDKDKDRGNFYLNNLRYGARLQVGFRSTDFFFNYDMNEIFASGKGPNLNAFSFGVIF
jgi:hypothetical protein